MRALGELLRVASPALVPAVRDGIPMLEKLGPLGAELDDLLRQRNGFYAFESSLHVFPWGTANGVLDLATWNAPHTWRDAYQDLADGLLLFAEDVFGFQFCLRGPQVCTFDAESGELRAVAGSLEDWAAAILADYRVMTGQPLAHAWQAANGPLAPGRRLAGKKPFFLGGEFDVANLYAPDQVKLMRFRGELAVQVRDLPDGASIQLRLVE